MGWMGAWVPARERLTFAVSSVHIAVTVTTALCTR